VLGNGKHGLLQLADPAQLLQIIKPDPTFHTILQQVQYLHSTFRSHGHD